MFHKLSLKLNILNVTVNDEHVIIRGCFWQYEKDECFYNKMPLDIKVDSCEICVTDGCNGNSHNSAHNLHVILTTTIILCCFFVLHNCI